MIFYFRPFSFNYGHLTGVQRNLHLVVLLEREEEEDGNGYLSSLLDQYPALHRNAEVCWSLAGDSQQQVEGEIHGICRLINCTGFNWPSYAAEVLSSLIPPPFSRSPLRRLQFVKTFTGLRDATTKAISSRCDVLKVSD